MAVMSPDEMTALRNEIIASMSPVMAGQEQARASLTPFMTGAPGSSPMTDAAIEAFKIKTLPLIQQQMLLAGMGHSPATAQVTGDTLAQALPQFIQGDMANRINAASTVGNMGAGAAGLSSTILNNDANLGLTGAKLSADIANNEAMRELQGYQTAGQLQLGAGDLALRTGQLQQAQQQMALQAAQGGGGLQRDVAQQVADTTQAERLRLQGLSENATTGLFGGNVLPSSLQQASTTKTSSSK